MTFKHTNFEDSVTMRSLEKLARDQGLVKDQPMTKAAASELDLSPSESLTENVLKLCAGLRGAGFDKYAVELEEKFLNYKQAQTLYEVNKETGDDLVHAAHPKGSHKLENVDSDEAVIEDILDQHMKHVKMVEKVPTGKLSSAHSILKAVKVALGQEMTEEQLIPLRAQKAIDQLKSVLPILDDARLKILNKMNTTTLAGSFESNYKDIKSVVDGLVPESLTVKNIDSVIGSLNSLQTSINFFSWKDLLYLVPIANIYAIWRHFGDVVDIASGDWDTKLRDKLTEFVTKAKNAASKARALVRGEADSEVKPAANTNPIATTKPSSEEGFIEQANRIISMTSTLNAMKAEARFANNKNLQVWFDEEIKEIARINDTYTTMKEAGGWLQPNELARMKAELDKVHGELNEFFTNYKVTTQA